MTSSGPSIALSPPHPKPAEHEAEAADESLPENEGLARPEVAGQDQRSEAEADGGERRAEPKPRERVAEQEERRPERHLFAWAHLPEKVRPYPAEGVEERERRENPEGEAGDGRRAVAQQDERAGDADEVDEEPTRAEPARADRDEKIPHEIDHTPEDDDERSVAVDARLLDPGDDAVDVGEHRGGFFGSNGHAVLAGQASALAFGASGLGSRPRRRQRKKSRR